MVAFYFLYMVATVRAATTDSCRDLLQGYLTGRLSSAVGGNQIEALRRQIKTNNDVMTKTIDELKKQFKADLQIIRDTRNKTVVYTRWGKKTCPSNAELVLSGYVGGSHHTHPGSAVEPLCLPRDPQWGKYKDGYEGKKDYIYGAEYQTTTNTFLRNVHDHDVPCAVCLVRNRSVVKMFPARKGCYKGWTLEYHGYLMAGLYTDKAGSQYTCIDHHPETLHGGHADMNGKLFFMVEAVCGSLKCPPYVAGREVVCAVCSRE